MTNSRGPINNSVPRSQLTFFLHFANNQMQRNYGIERRLTTGQISDALVMPMKLAYLAATGHLLIPTIDLVESPALVRLLPALQPLVDEGSLLFCGSAINPEDFVRHKREHFSSVRLYPEYFVGGFEDRLIATVGGWTSRTLSTTADVAKRWRTDVEAAADGSAGTAAVGPAGRLISRAAENLDSDVSKLNFVHLLHRLPELLVGEALLWEVAKERGYLRDYSTGSVEHSLRLALAQEWLFSHVDEYGAKLLTGLPQLGPMDCNLAIGPERHQACISYHELSAWLEVLGLLNGFARCSFSELAAIRRTETFQYFRIFWQRTFLGDASPQPDSSMLEHDILKELNGQRHRRFVARTAGSGRQQELQNRLFAICQVLAKYDSLPEPQISVQGGRFFGSVNITTGDIMASRQVINVVHSNTKRGAAVADRINIRTGDVTNSPAAINVNSTVGNINAAVERLEVSSNEDLKRVAAYLSELKVILEQQSVLTYSSTAEALRDVETIAAAYEVAGPESESSDPEAVPSALERLSVIAQTLSPTFASISVIVTSLRDLWGRG